MQRNRPRLIPMLASISLLAGLGACADQSTGVTADGGGGGAGRSSPGGAGGTSGNGGGAGSREGADSAGATDGRGGAGGTSGFGGTGGSGSGTGGQSGRPGGSGGNGGTLGGPQGGTISGGAPGTGAVTMGRGGAAGAGGLTGRGSGGTAGSAGRDGGARDAGAADLPATGGAGTGGTGAGGSTTNLPPGVTALFPAPDAANVCPDPPLRITFSGVPSLGTSGKIRVFDSVGTAVATVDMAASTITDTIGGTQFVLLRPVYVDGSAAVIYLKNGVLGYGKTYYVNVDSGAIKPPGGGSLAITGSTAWRFTTVSAPPTNLARLAVALDGSGQFCTVQGATDALPANNTAAATITVDPGTYHEIMRVYKKSNITLRGKDRAQTQIVGTNNNNQQQTNPEGAGTKNRALLSFESTNGLVIENLTIKNLTPQGGSQAEALRLKSCDKCVVRNADIWSLQDTLLWDGRIYAENCLIAGNVDYIWGTGAVYFNECEIRTVGRSGVIVQARNDVGAYGYVFVDCKLTVDSASSNNMLARIDVSVYPGSHVAYVNCQMTGVASAGWTVTGGGGTSSLRFWEYQSTDAAGNPINTSGRTGGSQISASQAGSMRDPTVVLGGWQP